MAESALQPNTVSLFDNRPFFERVLKHGIAHGVLDAEYLKRINQEAPKGIVQIARYFGTEFLRPELEAARERMVQLISLHLEHSCEGDLHRAALALRDHSLLSRSKAGSDMLKALIGMPLSTHFGLQTAVGFQDSDKPLLAKWSQRPLADYRAELELRTAIAQKVEAARWWATQWGLDDDELEDADAEAVIRTALLMHAARQHDAPDWSEFEALIERLRRKTAPPVLAVPKTLPMHLQGTVHTLAQSVQTDLALLLDSQRPIRKLLCHTPAFAGRYFWLMDPLSEVDAYAKKTSAAWTKATGGHDDEASLLTLFLCIAVGATHKTLLTPTGATRIARQLRKTGWQVQLPLQFIRQNAPVAHQEAFCALWESFVQESQATLLDDHDHTLSDAQALLRRECNVQA